MNRYALKLYVAEIVWLLLASLPAFGILAIIRGDWTISLNSLAVLVLLILFYCAMREFLFAGERVKKWLRGEK